jgi:hypothetical protein
MTTATTITATRDHRESTAYVRSVKAVLARLIFESMVGSVCVAGMALAEPAPLTAADFEGRWVSKEGKLTLDISRCGKDWCGVVVANKSCGHTALRVTESREDAIYQTEKVRELVGQLRLAANTEPYGVHAVLSRDEAGATRLFIAGHSGGEFAAFRRTYDYRNLMVRDGEATCSPDPKSS